MDETVESKMATIHFMVKEMFPEATRVIVFVNSEGIEVVPEFRTNLAEISMKTITGKWIKKA